MKSISALVGGLAGACAMTILHEIVKKIDNDAPRMDLLGMEAVQKEIAPLTHEPPSANKLFMGALTGDIAGNTLYYSLAGLGKKQRDLKGLALGVAAGLGAIYLPGKLGLSKKNSGKTDKTKALTTLYYALGGFVASEVMKLVENQLEKRNQKKLLTQPQLPATPNTSTGNYEL